MRDMELIYDSRNPLFQTPAGSASVEEEVIFSVFLSEKNAEVFLLLQKDGEEEVRYRFEPMGRKYGYFTYQMRIAPTSAGLYFYRFFIRAASGESIFGRGDGNLPSESSDRRWQLLCYSEEIRPPKAFSGKVFYQIFPDRFYREGSCDLSEKLGPFRIHENMQEEPDYLPDVQGEIKNNDFFGGNLLGITKKLDYLASLGVEVLYLNPIFMAYSNHRYDTADYKRIDPMLGTESDFSALCREAHTRGMKIILDGVFSHTGDRSVYFDRCSEFGGGAVSKPDSAFRSWYRFSEYPHSYESWWGIKTLPCVEEMEPSYLSFILADEDSVIRHWLRLGADGFRLDVADELPDEFLRILYRTVKEEKPDALVIGEVWEDASNKISYGVRRKYLWGEELDGVMNYVYRAAIIDFVSERIDAKQFMERISELSEHYPKETLLCSMNFLSTHDTARIFTLLAGKDGNSMSRAERANARLNEAEYKKGRKLLSAAVFLLFTLPGCPSIYYGDEIGMQGYEDPFNRRFFDWEHPDIEIMEEYRRLAKCHTQSEALGQGIIQKVSARGRFVIYSRRSDKEELFCALNLSDTPEEIVAGECSPLILNKCVYQDGILTVLPYGYAIW